MTDEILAMMNAKSMKIQDCNLQFVRDEVAKLPHVVGEYFKNSLGSLPREYGIVYKGIEEASVEDELTRTKKVIFDLTDNTMYIVIYVIECSGYIIKLPVRFPYVKHNNICVFGGTPYAITPVYTDNIITVTERGIFVKLDLDKPTFKSLPMNIIVNGTYKFANVVYVNALRVPVVPNPNKLVSTGSVSKAIAPSVIYVFIRYGIVDGFRKIFNTELNIGVGDIFSIDGKLVFRSAGDKLAGDKKARLKDPVYISIDENIGINTPGLIDIVTAIIYIFDVFENKISELLDLINNRKLDDEKYWWSVILVRATFRDTLRIDTLLDIVDKHLSTVDHYVNSSIRKKLYADGMIIDDFYDLVEYCTVYYSQLTKERRNTPPSILSKRLDINYYLTYKSFIEPINRVLHGLRKSGEKKRGPIPSKVAENILRTNVPVGSIDAITREGNIALTPITENGSNSYIITMGREVQERGLGTSRHPKGNKKPDPFPANLRDVTAEDSYTGDMYSSTPTTPTPVLCGNAYRTIVGGKVVLTDAEKEKIALVNSRVGYSAKRGD